MLVHERFKYCQHMEPSGQLCGKLAVYECTCGGVHPNDPEHAGYAVPPGPEELTDHPRFVCTDHGPGSGASWEHLLIEEE